MLSPDGRVLAVLDSERKILLYPMEGGAPTTAPGPPSRASWTPGAPMAGQSTSVRNGRGTGGQIPSAGSDDCSQGAVEGNRAGRSRRNYLLPPTSRPTENRTSTATSAPSLPYIWSRA